jgi:hypothetical protein
MNLGLVLSVDERDSLSHNMWLLLSICLDPKFSTFGPYTAGANC